MAVKVILDTDIGSDIDDAVALAYLLAQPECELLGITTVTGSAVERAKLASALCQVAGKKVPIRPGHEQPLLIEQRQKDCPQAQALPRWNHDREFPMGQAVTFLRDTIRANPGEVTLLTIGPLTNAGLLFALDPQSASLLRAHVAMAGVFGGGQLPSERRGKTEWNACGDPHATAICYRAAAHRSIGLDVTLQARMPAVEVRKRFAHKLLRPVLDFAEVWFQKRDVVTFHDPLAAATLFDGSLCRFERGDVRVELCAPGRVGATEFTPQPEGRHEIAVSVEVERFFEHYFGVFKRPG